MLFDPAEISQRFIIAQFSVSAVSFDHFHLCSFATLLNKLFFSFPPPTVGHRSHLPATKESLNMRIKTKESVKQRGLSQSGVRQEVETPLTALTAAIIH